MRPSSAGGALPLLPLLLGAAAPLPGEQYAERAGKLEGKKDAKAWLKLKDFAEEHLLWKEREEALRKTIDQDPEGAEAHTRLDEVKVGEEWLPAEEAEAREAEENQGKGLVFYGTKWVPAKEADKLREADRKQVGWDCDLRIQTPRFVLYSARSLPLSRRIIALLESDLAAYQRLYGSVWKAAPSAKPIRVYLFRDRASYERKLQADLSSPPGLPHGMYSAVTKVCYLGLPPDYKPGLDPEAYTEEQTARVAAHEMLHAFDDLMSRSHTVSPNRADWVLEGRADHFGDSVLGRQVLPGRVHLLHVGGSMEDRGVALAKGVEGLPLAQLLAMNTARFTGEGVREHYVMSWALVHFLFHAEGGRHAPAFRKFLAGCPKQSSPAEFEKTVGRLATLEPAFKDYVRKVLLPELE